MDPGGAAQLSDPATPKTNWLVGQFVGNPVIPLHGTVAAVMEQFVVSRPPFASLHTPVPVLPVKAVDVGTPVSVPMTVFEVLQLEPFDTGMPEPGNVEVQVLVGPQTYKMGTVVVVLKKPCPEVQVAGFVVPLGRFPTFTVQVFVGPQI
jgi:hypothetical protein